MRRSLRTEVCPGGFAWILDNPVRRWLHRPEEIFGQLITTGLTVVELGCGSGPFTIPLAEMVGPAGRVIAADLQPAMLAKVRKVAAALQSNLALVARPAVRLSRAALLAKRMVKAPGKS